MHQNTGMMLRLATRALFLCLLLTAAGCSLPGIQDPILSLGKWGDEETGVDFRLSRFTLDFSFSAGRFTVVGDYTLNPDAYPKEVDFTVRRIEYVLGGDGGEKGTWRRISIVQANDLHREMLATAETSEDVLAAQKLLVFLESLASGLPAPGIYSVEVTFGTYLTLGYNRPATSRPWDMEAALVREDY